MLVYLDSAQFDALERASEAERDAFFVSWQAAGCELALSLHHIHEIGQLGDRESLVRRLRVLKRFPLIRGGLANSDAVLRFEIRELLKSHPERFPSNAVVHARAKFFPEADLSGLTDATIHLQPVFHLFRDALATSAHAEALSKQGRAVGAAKIPSDMDWDALYERSLTEIDAAEQAASIPKGSLRELFDTYFKAARTHGSTRATLVALFDLGRVGILERIPDDDLPSANVFYHAAREEFAVLTSGANLLPPAKKSADEIDMYAAPGYRLKLAVRRGRRHHPKKPVPSDQTDEDHVMFAPYVDLLIADKRTLGFVAQKTRNPFLQLPSDSVASIRRVADLRECTSIIDEIAHVTTTRGPKGSVSNSRESEPRRS